jgi:hypothetical protein
VNWGTSWVAPLDIQRVDSRLSDNQVGAVQVQELDLRHPKQKVIVPGRIETCLPGEQTVKLAAWQGQHFKKLSGLVGMVLQVEFLRADGTPRYQRPM